MSKNFNAYRYQLLPLDRNSTKDLYNAETSEELLKNKNRHFSDSILQLPKGPNRARLQLKVEALAEDLYRMTFAPSRPLTRETLDKRREPVENWPHIEILILNHPDDQILLIQDRATAYSSTDTVANLLKKMTRLPLEGIGLTLAIEKIYNEEHFWRLISAHKNRITKLEFNFVTPNMASISAQVSEVIKTLSKESNATRQQITLSSDPSSSLDISSQNKLLKNLVTYISEGAGSILIKVKGLRKKINASGDVLQININGLEASSDPKDLKTIIKSKIR